MRWVWIVAIAGCHGHEPASTADAVPADVQTETDAISESCPPMTTIDPTTAPELSIGSNPAVALGIFDPSVVYPAGATAGAMAYSAVPDQHSIRTRVAVSSDQGTTWSYVADANEPEAATLQSISGNLISEVPSLVFDADEPDPTHLWKLFSHRYLVEPNNTLHYDIGTITLQTAPSPNGPWTEPQKLIGWGSGDAYSATDVVVNVSSLAGDGDCVALTEPGAIWLPGTLDLALGCVYPAASGGAAIRVILVRSVDHGASWSAVSTLLTSNDSECLVPGGSINAADLFVTGSHEYVVATSGLADGTYRGCAVYPIDDPAAGTVRRAPDGVAYPIRTMSATVFSGACTFADAGGYLMDIGLLGDASPFHIFHAGTSL